jgi:hypothetical protein
MKIHKTSSTFPFKCKVCGKDNIEKLIMLFYYRGEGWFTMSYCSEKCFSKLGIPYVVSKQKGNLLTKIKGYRFHEEIIHNGLKYVYPVKEYLIEDNQEINPYEIFECK